MSKTVIKLDESWRAYLDSLGANAGFVEGLIYQYLEDPAQVDERWRRTFDAVAGRKVNGNQAGALPEVATRRTRETVSAASEPAQSVDEAGQAVTMQGATAKLDEQT